MAVKVLRVGNSVEGYLVNSDGVYHEFICDAEADVASLPTNAGKNYTKPRAGSTALVCATGNVYVLTPSRTWVRLIEGTD